MKVLTAVKMAHFLLTYKLTSALHVVDATAGNGKDTLFIARNTPANATVTAFDIQTQALDKTRELLAAHQLEHKVHFIHDSHANLQKYCINPLDVIMFNLGYLPGGEHAVTTTSESTLTAVQAGLGLLAVGGVMTIAAYHGHAEGRRELAELQNYLTNIPQSVYTVACWKMVNQTNRPPMLYVIEKLRG